MKAGNESIRSGTSDREWDPWLAGAGLEFQASGYLTRAVLVIDAEGVISCCKGDTTGLVGLNEDSLVGLPVRELIPALPFSETTPAYNIAYIRFWFRGGCWRRVDPMQFNGKRIPLIVSVRDALFEGKQLLYLLIRDTAD